MATDVEERLRRTLAEVSDRIEVDGEQRHPPLRPVADERTPRNRHRIVVLAAAALVVLIGIVANVVVRTDGDDGGRNGRVLAGPPSRNQLVADAGRVRAYLGTIPAAGGLAFDTRAGSTRLRVSVGGSIDRHRAALQRLVTHPGQLDVVGLEYTGAQLEAIAAEIRRRFPGPGELLSYDTPGSLAGKTHVSVGLRSGHEGVADELLDRYGTALLLEVGAFAYPAAPDQPDTCPTLGARQTELSGQARPVRTTYGDGDTISGEVTLLNRGSAVIELSGSGSLSAALVDPNTGAVSAYDFGLRALVLLSIRLEPGQSRTVQFTGQMGACRVDPDRGTRLRPGRYNLVVLASMDTRGDQPVIVSEPESLTITAAN